MSAYRQILGQVEVGKVRQFRMDASTGALMTIDYAHHEIHEGSDFNYSDLVTLGSGAAQNYVLVTPNTTKWAHFGYEVEASFGITVEMFMGSDRTPTTAQTVFNRNHNSTKAATMLVYKNYSAGTTDGTRFIWRKSGTGTSGGKLSGVAGEATERILRQNTQYTFRVTSAAASNDVSIRLNWYEHTDRD